MAINATIIKNLSALRDVPDTALEGLGRICVARAFAKGEMIYLRGGAEGRVFLMLEGEVKLYLASGGQRIVIDIFRPGEFFGDMAFVNHPFGLPSEDYAESTQDTKLCVVTSDEFTRFIHADTAFAMVLLVALRNRLHAAQSKIKDLAISSAPTRLLNELIRLALSHGKEQDGRYEIADRFTHQQLAEMSGLARETVTKTLGELEKQGFISYTPDHRVQLHVKTVIRECAECLNLASLSEKPNM